MAKIERLKYIIQDTDKFREQNVATIVIEGEFLENENFSGTVTVHIIDKDPRIFEGEYPVNYFYDEFGFYLVDGGE